MPPAYLAKHLQAMAHAGLVESTPGRNGGYRLARPAAEISLLEVIDAVEGGEPAFRCTEIRRPRPSAWRGRRLQGPVWDRHRDGPGRGCVAGELASVSIADLLRHVAVTVSPVSIRKAAGWFQEALN